HLDSTQARHDHAVAASRRVTTPTITKSGCRTNRDEARAMELAAGGVPVLVIRRVAYDRTGRAVEVNDMTLAGNRYELTYEIPAD
ncbi:UTRA domain-containing protein, partial [Kribbella steppae]